MPPLPAQLLQPWLISPDGLKLVLAVASRDEFYADIRDKALAAHNGKALSNTRATRTFGQTAVVPVRGPLFRHAGMLTEISGATSYDALRNDIKAALDNKAVSNIVLDIDSPGGEANGCFELCDFIYEARSKKPIEAYVGGSACSAAWAIASSASRITIAETGEAGSIGVVATAVKPDADGGKTVEIVSSQSPYKRLDVTKDEDRARLQQRIDDVAKVFIDKAARNRGVSTAVVEERFGRGDIMVGARAVAAGLADRIGNFDAVLSELSNEAKMNTVCATCSTAAEEGAKMYCAGCYSAEASAAVTALMTATGKSSTVEALATVAAWKELAAESTALKEQIQAQQIAAESAAFDAEIANAKAIGLLAKSDDHKRNVAALAYKAQAESIKGLRTFLAALDPLAAPAAPVAAQPPAPAAPDPVSGLTPEERHVLKATGGDPVKFLAHKQSLLALRNPVVVEEK